MPSNNDLACLGLAFCRIVEWKLPQTPIEVLGSNLRDLDLIRTDCQAYVYTKVRSNQRWVMLKEN
jgi:hypothetical protein